MTLITILRAVVLGMPCDHRPTRTEGTVAVALVVDVRVVHVPVRVEFHRLVAIVLAVPQRVHAPLHTDHTPALARPLDVRGEVQAEVHLLHLLKQFRLSRRWTT